MGLEAGSVIDLAYRVKVDERWETGRHHSAGGLGGVELEIAGMRGSAGLRCFRQYSGNRHQCT